jgi:predicted MFS family arabinose efflux permease
MRLAGKKAPSTWIPDMSRTASIRRDKQMGNSSPVNSVLPVATMFAASGFVAASSFSRLPAIRDRLNASPSELTFVLVSLGLGSMIGMSSTGRLLERYSSRMVGRWATCVFLGGWGVLPVIANSVVHLALLLFLTGIGAGAAGVAMNVQGHLVENRCQKVLMPLWHGLFSLGAAAGAFIGGFGASLQVPVTWHLPVVSAAMFIPMWLATRGYISPASPRDASTTAEEPLLGVSQVYPSPSKIVSAPRLVRSRTSIDEILLGVIAFATAFGEGAANSWLALMLVDDRGASAAFGAVTYAGFNITMALGRLMGGVIIQRFGRVPVLRVGGALGSAGVTILCLVPALPVAILGALAWGIGLSVVFPSTISAGGEVPNRGSRAIALIATLGYTGFSIGSPLIGLLANVVPLDRALLTVAALVLLITFLAPVAQERGALDSPVD